jgi:hypothetical protein
VIELVLKKKENDDWTNNPPITGVPVSEEYVLTDKSVTIDSSSLPVSVNELGTYYGDNEPYTESSYESFGFTGNNDSCCEDIEKVRQLFSEVL